VKVFISSVRTGLEEERDALPGLISALGHTPVRFEEFSAQNVPSREACLAAVADSDVYLLLLGPHYGYRFPETGQSATHDEWKGAQQSGLQIYAFRKNGVAFDADQEEFAREVGSYGSGRFWKTFETTAGLQQVVVEAIREAQSQPAALDFAPLPRTLRPAWLPETPLGSRSPLIEVQVAPVNADPIADRVFRQAAQRLPGMLRSEGVVSQLSGLELSDTPDTVAVRATDAEPRIGWHDIRPSRFESAYMLKSGQIGLTFALPADQMSSFLDREDAIQNLTRGLHLVHRMEYVSTTRCAISLRVTQAARVTIGTVPGTSRSSMSMTRHEDVVELVPDESVPTAALGSAAGEIAANSVEALLRALR
jgi:hypothetical protein